MLLFCRPQRKSRLPVCVLPSRTLGVWTLPRTRRSRILELRFFFFFFFFVCFSLLNRKCRNKLPLPSSSLDHHEREVFFSRRRGGGHGLHRRAAAAAQEPQRLAELQRRLLEGHGADVREEDDDPGRPEPEPEPRGQPAGPQAAEPGRGAGAAAEGDGGSPAAGHVPAVPAVVAARVHPGVQGQLPGPERRLQPQPDGERLLRRGRRVLPGDGRHPHRGAAGRGARRRRGGGEERQRRRQRRQLGLVSRHHLRSSASLCRWKDSSGETD